MGNTFGHSFRITTWGESHGDAVGVVVDGCPPRLEISVDELQKELDRRRPAQSEIASQRKEGDKAEILSGVFDGLTLGTPILIGVWNEDARGKDYDHLRNVFRPSHADYTYEAKYGIRNWKGGGRASARETVGRVAAGAIAKKVLAQEFGVEIGVEVKISGESFLTPPGPLSDLVAAAVEAETGLRPELSTTGGTSDARFVKDHCPVVEFGLVGQTMHQVDERVEIAQIHRLKSVYARILKDYFT